MGNVVQLDINANNNASPVVKEVAADIRALDETTNQVTQSTGSATGGIVSFNAALEVTKQIAGVVKDVLVQVVGEAQSYDQAILDIMLSTGGTAAESSRLVQVVDDVGISYSTLKTAMKMASKEGIEPNIESLMKLSDEYLALAPGVERNQFLMDKFGKSGMDMARAMELGGDKLQSMNDSIQGGLVLTQQAIDESEEYRENMDELSDSAQGFKVTLGNQVIPAVNDFIDSIKRQNEAMAEATEKVGPSYHNYAARYEATLISQRNANIEAADAVAAHGDKLDGIIPKLTTTTEVTAEAAKATSDYYTSTLAGAERQYEINQDFIASQEDLRQKQADLLPEIEQAKYWWGENSQQVLDLQGKYDGLGVKLEETAEKHRQKLGEMQYDLLLTALSADGLTGAEYDMAVAAGVAFGVFDQEAANAQLAQKELTDAVLDGSLEFDDYGRMMKAAMADGIVTAQELRAMIASIPGEKNVSINVKTNYSSQYNGNYDGNYSQLAANNRYAEGTDGWQTVPPGYPNDSYPIMLQSGERFAVIPEGVNAQPSAAGGGGVGGGLSLTLNNYSTFSFGNEAEAREKIAPLFLSLLQEAKANGVI